MVTILVLGSISSMSAPRTLVFPDPLPPATSMLTLPSIMKESRPAASGSIILALTNRGRVHGLSLCLLIANPKPCGDKPFVMTANLAFPPGTPMSVSRTGFASSSGLPECILRRVAQDSASSLVGIRFVLHSSKSWWKIRMG